MARLAPEIPDLPLHNLGPALLPLTRNLARKRVLDIHNVHDEGAVVISFLLIQGNPKPLALGLNFRSKSGETLVVAWKQRRGHDLNRNQELTLRNPAHKFNRTLTTVVELDAIPKLHLL